MYYKLILFLVIVYLINICSCKNLPVNEIRIRNDVRVRKAANPMISILFDYLSTNGIDELVGSILKEVLNETSQCNTELGILYNGTKKRQKWALQMLDATAKPQPGILSGNILHVGNYDECLKIKHNFNKTVTVKGKYCTALFTKSGEKPSLDVLLSSGAKLMQLRTSYGFCLPKSCRAEDLQKITDNLETLLKSPVNFYFYDEICSSAEESTELTWTDYFTLSIFSFLGILILFSTTYDIFVSKGINDNAKSQLYTLFSFYTNAKSLLSTKSGKASIACLNGIKVLSLAWVILSHRYMYTLYVPLINYADILEQLKTYPSAFILTGSLAVDSFFLTTGLLIVYLFLNNHAKGRTISWPLFYIHRILRLTPSLAAMVLVYSTIFDNIGSGPFWFLVKNVFQKFCKNNWWSTLLYVQNYVNPNDICLGQSWYLAVDTQIYFLSPVILLSLIKWPVVTIAGILSVVFLSDGYTFVASHVKNLGPAFFGSEEDMFKFVYVPTHTRCAPWLIGAILGYMIFKIKNRPIKIKKILVILSWLLTLASIFGIVHVHKLLATDNSTLVMENALYNSLIRTLWSFAISAIILLCVTGNGGIINKILSWSIFVVLSKLCYSMYLVQLLVIISSTAQIRTPEYFSHMFKIKQFFGDFIAILLLSVIWTLTFEAPIIRLEGLIFKRKKQAPQENLSNGNHIEFERRCKNIW